MFEIYSPATENLALNASRGSLSARRHRCLLLCAAILISADQFVGHAAEDNSARGLADLSLEELMKQTVTSVSKRSTSLQDSPAAVTILTQEDIRRSGATSVPELLRMVPGMDVARINANEWAVSARGFNSQYATKLLVMVDGRSVYTPTFSGVYWNTVDLVLEDLDRIEVIRGPGASLWGANAVNGVVNVVTKSARDTQGFLVDTIYGLEDQPTTSLRYGGKLGENLHYRVYGKYFNRDNFPTTSRIDAADDSRAIRGGLRLDWDASEQDLLTFQADFHSGEFGQNGRTLTLTPPFAQNLVEDNDNHGMHFIGRWTRTYSEESALTVQTYYDEFQHIDSAVVERRMTYDLDVQHYFPLGNHQSLMWGVGFRYTRDHLTGNPSLVYTPDRFDEALYSFFVQDEITLFPDKLKLTIGSKFEHNDYTGIEVQPSGRLAWTPTEKQTVWGSISRAVRTPARWETHSRLDLFAFSNQNGVNVSSLIANPQARAEELMAYEVGYRIEPLPKLSLDLAAFYNYYDSLLIYEAAPPFQDATPSPHTVWPSVYQNNGYGPTYGGEVALNWHPTENWRLAAGYTLLLTDLRPANNWDLAEGNNPQNQFHLRSYLNFTKNLELNGAVYYVDRLPQQQVSSYVRLDLGLVWRINRSMDVGLWGQNLLDKQHSEFTSFNTSLRTEIPRNVFVKFTWRF